MKRKSSIIISLVLLMNMLLAVSYVTKLGSSWTSGSSEDTPLIATAGTMPTIDGYNNETIKEWEDSNSTILENIGNIPRLEVSVMLSSNYLLILIEVKITNHNADEFIRLLLSNSSDSEDEDFFDGKLIQNHNFTVADTENRTSELQDEISTDGITFINETSLDFEGAANISTGVSYSYYEFKIPFSSNNDDEVNDTKIFAGSVYALKIEFGYNDGNSISSEKTQVLYVQTGLSYDGDEDDLTGNPFNINMDLVSNIMFVIAFIAYGIIAVIGFQTKKNVNR